MILSVPKVWAAEIFEGSRSLQAIVDMVDFNPVAGDETSDISGGWLEPVFADTVQTTNTLNENSVRCSAGMDTTMDRAGLKFGGSGSASLNGSLNFDANDISNGAFIDVDGVSSYSIIFKIAASGKVQLSGTLQAGGTGATQRASVRVGRWDGSGVALWSREITSGTQSFTADVALAQGSYIVNITALTQNSLSPAPIGPATLTSNASFVFTGQITEVVTAPPRGGKPRK